MKWFFIFSVLVILSFFVGSCQFFLMPGMYEEISVVYVSTDGNDNNNGLSAYTPVKSLVKAMEIANGIWSTEFVEVRVKSGLYTNGNGLSNTNVGFVINRDNIKISGGWDDYFNKTNGSSVLNGNSKLYHIIWIKNVSNVILENLVIMGGYANVANNPDDRGGGIYAEGVSYSIIESNVVVSNNFAGLRGGGIYLLNSHSNRISCLVTGNNANTDGGGIYLNVSSGNIIDGKVCSNLSYTLGGGMFLNTSDGNVIKAKVYGNKVNGGIGGGGISLWDSVSNTIEGEVFNNEANSGGGIHLGHSANNIISASIHNNNSINGGGIYFWDSAGNLISGNIYSNSSQYGGGIRFEVSVKNMLTGNVYHNTATDGGGIYLYNSDYFTNTGWISNNTASGNGGGVYKNGLYPNSSFGNVRNNSPNDFNP